MADRLKSYRAKRDPKRTPEPFSKRKRPRKRAPRFVIHEHHARRLHWDLRLERDGALASWAIPKGMPADPARNHMAVPTEDHPLDYLDFEGEIPPGEYGAGNVYIWDSGTYECEKWTDREILVTLHGRQVDATYALFPGGRDSDWLIHRKRDEIFEGTAPSLKQLIAAGRRLPRGDVEVELQGRTLTLKNLDKVFYPATGFTKGDLLDYYLRISPQLLPHLAGRPLTLKRYPNGIEGGHFFEKRCPAHHPPWVATAAVPSRRTGTIEFCVVNDLPTLLWAANLATLELHISLSVANRIERPTTIVFDLDPGPPADVLDCARVALLLRALLDEVGLSSLIKTSGSKGLQLYAPLNTVVGYDETKDFARAVARTLENGYPDLVVSRMAKQLRRGKVFIDWSQNDEHKTTVSVYSLRATARPMVSTPLAWEEVERASKSGKRELLEFDAAATLRRAGRRRDAFRDVLTTAQPLPRF
jgi:DNA ligase D-like protein (predicted polymerase)/DNA ligase D-like protein (predicted 3'-phosphoesterase)